MLFFALLQAQPKINHTTAELILRGRGIGNNMLSHGRLVLAEIRDESFREESDREFFFNTLSEQGLALLLLIETDVHGTAEILFPKPYGERKSPEEKQSDEEADKLMTMLCDFLAVIHGRGWEKKQKIWKLPRLVPCA